MNILVSEFGVCSNKSSLTYEAATMEPATEAGVEAVGMQKLVCLAVQIYELHSGVSGSVSPGSNQR